MSHFTKNAAEAKASRLSHVIKLWLVVSKGMLTEKNIFEITNI